MKDIEQVETVVDIPEEIHSLFADMVAAEECRDICIKSLFKAKRAIYYARKYSELNRKVWSLIKELFEDHYVQGKFSYKIDKKQLVWTPNKEEKGK